MLPVVREAEMRLAADTRRDHEYIPILGSESFCASAVELLLGADSPARKEGRVSVFCKIRLEIRLVFSACHFNKTWQDLLSNYF